MKGVGRAKKDPRLDYALYLAKRKQLFPSDVFVTRLASSRTELHERFDRRDGLANEHDSSCDDYIYMGYALAGFGMGDKGLRPVLMRPPRLSGSYISLIEKNSRLRKTLIDENEEVLPCIMEGDVCSVFGVKFPTTHVGFIRAACYANLEGEGLIAAGASVVLTMIEEKDPDPFRDFTQGEIYYADAAVCAWAAESPDADPAAIPEIRSYMGELHNRLHPWMAPGLTNPRTGMRMYHPGNPSFYSWAPATRFPRDPCASGVPRCRSLRSYMCASEQDPAAQESMSYAKWDSRPVPTGQQCAAQIRKQLPREIQAMLSPGNIILAGGAALSMTTGKDFTDFDLYFLMPTSIVEFVERHGLIPDDEHQGFLLGERHLTDNTYLTTPCYTCTTLTGLKVDLILTFLDKFTEKHPIDLFDLSVCQFWYDGQTLRGSPRAVADVNGRELHVIISEQRGYTNTYARIQKYAKRGYTLVKDDMFNALARNIAPLRGGADAEAYLELAADVPDFPEFPVVKALIENRAKAKAEASVKPPEEWARIRGDLEAADFRAWDDFIEILRSNLSRYRPREPIRKRDVPPMHRWGAGPTTANWSVPPPAVVGSWGPPGTANWSAPPQPRPTDESDRDSEESDQDNEESDQDSEESDRGSDESDRDNSEL
jgi:hypothetical protein